jgi:hypothetical protein
VIDGESARDRGRGDGEDEDDDSVDGKCATAPSSPARPGASRRKNLLLQISEIDPATPSGERSRSGSGAGARPASSGDGRVPDSASLLDASFASTASAGSSVSADPRSKQSNIESAIQMAAAAAKRREQQQQQQQQQLGVAGGRRGSVGSLTGGESSALNASLASAHSLDAPGGRSGAATKLRRGSGGGASVDWDEGNDADGGASEGEADSDDEFLQQSTARGALKTGTALKTSGSQKAAAAAAGSLASASATSIRGLPPTGRLGGASAPTSVPSALPSTGSVSRGLTLSVAKPLSSGGGTESPSALAASPFSVHATLTALLQPQQPQAAGPNSGGSTGSAGSALLGGPIPTAGSRSGSMHSLQPTAFAAPATAAGTTERPGSSGGVGSRPPSADVVGADRDWDDWDESSPVKPKAAASKSRAGNQPRGPSVAAPLNTTPAQPAPKPVAAAVAAAMRHKDEKEAAPSTKAAAPRVVTAIPVRGAPLAAPSAPAAAKGLGDPGVAADADFASSNWDD